MACSEADAARFEVVANLLEQLGGGGRVAAQFVDVVCRPPRMRLGDGLIVVVQIVHVIADGVDGLAVLGAGGADALADLGQDALLGGQLLDLLFHGLEWFPPGRGLVLGDGLEDLECSRERYACSSSCLWACLVSHSGGRSLIRLPRVVNPFWRPAMAASWRAQGTQETVPGVLASPWAGPCSTTSGWVVRGSSSTFQSAAEPALPDAAQ